MTSFKFRSCSPEGGVCTIHDVVMESIRGEPSSLIVRHADGSCEEQEGHRVLGYRHQLHAASPQSLRASETLPVPLGSFGRSLLESAPRDASGSGLVA
jgi:hypothetical protein